MDVNANISHCLRTVTNIGSDTVVNICNGVHTTIPWGAGDWATAVGATVLLGTCSLMLFTFFVMLWKMVHDI